MVSAGYMISLVCAVYETAMPCKASHFVIFLNNVSSRSETPKDMRDAATTDNSLQGYRPTCRVFTEKASP